MQNNQTTTSDKKTNGNGKWMTKTANEAEEAVSQVSETAREIYENAMKSGSDLISRANKNAAAVVREYPVQATVGGLILGFLLGASLFRRRS